MLRKLLLAMAFVGMTFAGCQKQASPEQASKVSSMIGKTYYAQVTFQHEKGRHRTTNYRRGSLVRVNTAAKLLEIGGREAVIELSTGERIEILNHEDHTGKTIYEVFDRMFSASKLNLSKFSSKERQMIDRGEAAVGMSKDAVLAALGYPPITYTQTIQSDDWKYWHHRYNTFVVHFRNGRVTSIEQ